MKTGSDLFAVYSTRRQDYVGQIKGISETLMLIGDHAALGKGERAINNDALLNFCVGISPEGMAQRNGTTAQPP